MSPAVQKEVLCRALRRHAAGDPAGAEALCQQVLAAARQNFDAFHLAGVLALQRGEPSKAVPLLTSARRLQPGNAQCAVHLGIALYRDGQVAGAQEALEAATRANPRLAEAWIHLATLLRQAGRPGEAMESLRQARTLCPENAAVEEQLGTLLVASRGPGAGEPHLRRATELNPRHAPAWANLGVCLAAAGDLEAALAAFDRAASLAPGLAHAHAGRGLVLSRCLQHGESVAAYQRALALAPGHFEAWSGLLYQRHFSADLSAAEIFAEHQGYGRAVAPSRPPPPFPNRPDPDRRLRIAFLSPDLLSHSIAYFVEPLLREIDRSRCEILLFHDRLRTDEVSARLRTLADGWTHTAGMSDDAVESLVRSAQIDILIDLAGHTGCNRMPLLARRIAPVQATYLGYPDTTGVPAIGYRLVDAETDPPGPADALATEKLLRFAPTAWSYQAPAGPAPRTDSRKSPAPVTFGCLNNLAKASPPTLGAWARLLRETPGSRLLLKSPGLGLDIVGRGARSLLAAAGIDLSRVDLLERTTSVEEHLEVYHRIDVALDPFPYHGTTTTCEALWMGVPVVTLQGDRHCSRVGSSLLRAVGHPEWIAGSWEEYLEIAGRLGREASAGRLIPAEIRASLQRSPLMDHRGQAVRFELGLREAWRTWCAAEGPAIFA